MKKLSILVITYNHEKYIRQAIESILIQKMDFDYEVILADDCSTDSTQKILMEYVDKYPTTFKPHFSPKNLGVTKNYGRAFKLCSAEYVAVLEGDDYWTDVQKLTKQIKFLDEHRESPICFNRFWGYFEDKNKFVALPNFVNSEPGDYRFLTLEQLIKENFIGNFSTCMYRNSELQKIDEKIFELTAYDWMINMYLAQFGVIGYLPNVMSVYRIHSAGTWSGLGLTTQIEKTLASIESYNKFFNNKYAAEFEEVRRIYQRQLRVQQLKNQPMIRVTKNILKKAYHIFQMIIPSGIWVLLGWLMPPLFKQMLTKPLDKSE